MLSASPATIDRDGLHRTNLRLLARALAAIQPCPDVCLVDGFRLGDAAPEHRRVVGGDHLSASIAAASVIAKTVRDRLMAGPVAEAYPAFGFASHVGYATIDHRSALRTPRAHAAAPPLLPVGGLPGGLRAAGPPGRLGEGHDAPAMPHARPQAPRPHRDQVEAQLAPLPRPGWRAT